MDDNWKELPADKSLMSQPEGEHVPIGNIIVTSEIDEKLKDAADAYLKGILPDGHQPKRWIDDVILERLKEQENWPKGTEVIIYCHNEDREAIKAEVECKGYKIAGYVSYNEIWHLKKGQYAMAKKEVVQWNPNTSTSHYARMHF